jgi:pimeloyl-ACP methyl ester carboxylesterase
LLTREVNLSTFVQDIVAALNYEDLNDVILVGHSFAGMVITGVADRVPDKLARLVYLDSTMPSAGRSFMDVNTATLGKTVQQAVDSDGDGWRLPPFSLSSMGVTDAEDLEWMESKMCDHPLAAATEPLQFDSSVIEAVPRTYIRCTDGSPWLADTAARLKADEGWQYIEIESGHDAMVTVPQELAEILMSLV